LEEVRAYQSALLQLGEVEALEVQGKLDGSVVAQMV
jgi:hypothetical protein